MDTATLGPLVTALIPVIVPFVVNYVKKPFASAVPWAVVPTAVILGGVLDMINGYTTGHNVGGFWGLVLGASGVAVREFINNLRK